LAADLTLAASYGIALTRNQSEQSTFDRGDGKYQELVDSLSNDYKEDVLEQRGTLLVYTMNRSFTYTLGGDIARYGYTTEDIAGDSTAKYHYLAFVPRVNMGYVIDKSRKVLFAYSGSTQLPSITQLQPLQNNNDPLHIALGNPDLRPSFTHQFSASFTQVNPAFIYLSSSWAFIENSISSKTYTDSLGRQVSEPVNVNGSFTGSFHLGLRRSLHGIDFGLHSDLSLGRNVNYLGDILSDNNSYRVGGGLSIGKFVADRYGLSLNTVVNYHDIYSSVNLVSAVRYWTSGEILEASYFLLPGFQLNSYCNYSWRQKTSLFDKDNTTVTWNAFISKNLFGNKWSIRCQVNNILDQNLGISRNIDGNTVAQTAANMIGRYWMVSLIYRFNHRFNH
jgi:outer membrane receptor protein involved in Fe transport